MRLLAVIVVALAIALGQADRSSSNETGHAQMAPAIDWGAFYTNLGKEALQKGQYHRANRALTAAIKKGAPAEAYKYRALALDKIGRRTKAVTDVNTFISLAPRSPWGYIQLGSWFNVDGQFEKALESFRKAIERDRRSCRAYVGRAVSHMGIGVYELAIQDFRKGLELQPSCGDAFVNLGVAYMVTERPKEALRVLGRARNGTTDPKWTHKIQGWLEELRGDLKTSGSPSSKPVHRPETDAASVDPGDYPPGLNRDGHGRPSALSVLVPQDPEGVTAPDAGRQTSHPSGPSPATKVRSNRGVKSLDGSDISGTWKFQYMGAEVTIEVNQDGDKVSGVFRVEKRPLINESHSFSGTFRQGAIRAVSDGGHELTARLSSKGMHGSLRMKNGLTLPVHITGN